MTKPNLPKELLDVEQQLFATCQDTPSSVLRARVLASIDRARMLDTARRPRLSFWSFAASAAAIAIIWVNVSRSITSRPVSLAAPARAYDFNRQFEAVESLFAEKSVQTRAPMNVIVENAFGAFVLRTKLLNKDYFGSEAAAWRIH